MKSGRRRSTTGAVSRTGSHWLEATEAAATRKFEIRDFLEFCQQAEDSGARLIFQNLGDVGMLFEQEEWTRFRSLNTLPQVAGVSVDLIPRLVAKELVDNALDATGACQAGLLKDRNGIWVTDDGPGIPGSDSQIAAMFSVKRAFTTSKLLRGPTRGALGNGLRVVAGAVLATSGSLTLMTQGRFLELMPQADTGETIARRIKTFDYDDPYPDGCRIYLEFGPSLKVDSHTLDWANDAIAMAQGKNSYEGESSPYWFDSESFYEMLQAAGTSTVREVITKLKYCAEPLAGKIAAPFKQRLAKDLGLEEADRLLRNARAHGKRVETSSLGQVGRKIPGLPSSWGSWDGFITLGSPRSLTMAELPVVVEAWAQVSEDSDAESRVRLCVNRTPITGEIAAWTEKSVLNVSGCGCYFEIPSARKPVELWINIETPHMPITTNGKEPDITKFVGAIREAATKAIEAAKRKARVPRDQKLTKKDAILNNLAAGIAEASGDGRFRFSQRQLFYAIRPKFMQLIGEEPIWETFTKVITDYENLMDKDIPGMYRDPRGIIYHPHIGQEIPLGTLYVEKYERPAWLFSKVLYIEKEGLFSILRAVEWPERNDCALMTSKGFSSRAARDLIDFLAETDEECTFYCVHDADAAGTMIYQTL